MSEQLPNIFSITAVNPEEQPLADAAAAAMNVVAMDTSAGRALLVGSDWFRDPDNAQRLRAHSDAVLQELMASGFTWREAVDNDLADAVSSIWAVQPPKRPKRPRAEVALPWERCYVTGDQRKEMAQRLREVADLVEAGYNLHAAETHDYDRLFHMRFELSGEPVVNYPTDNSPALGGQKETT